MWSERRSFLFALPACLAGCGFSPVYGPGGTGAALYGKIEVRAPTTLEEYLYVQDLEQAFGRSSAPEYRLTYKIRTESSGQAVTATGDITRYNLLGRVTYQLTRIDNSKVIAKGTIDNFAGYSATGSTVDTLSAERDSIKRLMVILADQTVEQLFLTADIAS